MNRVVMRVPLEKPLPKLTRVAAYVSLFFFENNPLPSCYDKTIAEQNHEKSALRTAQYWP